MIGNQKIKNNQKLWFSERISIKSSKISNNFENNQHLQRTVHVHRTCVARSFNYVWCQCFAIVLVSFDSVLLREGRCGFPPAVQCARASPTTFKLWAVNFIDPYRNYPRVQNLPTPSEFTSPLQNLPTPSNFTHPFRI